MIESPLQDGALAAEQMWSFCNDLRACVGMMEAILTLDTSAVTHPHGMAPEIRDQRNQLLRVARKLCRAEMVQRWAALQDRWPMFIRAIDHPTW